MITYIKNVLGLSYVIISFILILIILILFDVIAQHEPHVVQLLTPPHLGTVLYAGPAQFGYDLKKKEGVSNENLSKL